jgi:hypothetical protein
LHGFVDEEVVELADGSVRVATPLAPGAQAATSDHLPVTATVVARE